MRTEKGVGEQVDVFLMSKITILELWFQPFFKPEAGLFTSSWYFVMLIMWHPLSRCHSKDRLVLSLPWPEFDWWLLQSWHPMQQMHETLPMQQEPSSHFHLCVVSSVSFCSHEVLPKPNPIHENRCKNWWQIKILWPCVISSGYRCGSLSSRVEISPSNGAAPQDPPVLLLEDVLSADECEEFVESMRTQDGNWTEGFWIHVPAPGSIAMEIPWNQPFPNWKCRHRFTYKWRGSIAILIRWPEGMLFSRHRTFLFECGGKVNSCGSVLILQCWFMLAEILAWLVCWLQVSQK